MQKKCAKYWPDVNSDKDCDVIIINTFEEKQYANYVIRKIRMSNKKVIHLFLSETYFLKK